MNWNHRLLAHQSPNGEVYLHIHEVYYDENGKPNGYTEDPVSVGGETVREITWVLNRMKECRKKPILWAGEKFPSEYVLNVPSTNNMVKQIKEQANEIQKETSSYRG